MNSLYMHAVVIFAGVVGCLYLIRGKQQVIDFLELHVLQLRLQNGMLNVQIQILESQGSETVTVIENIQPDTLCSLRNALLKHHEQRRLDASYQQSSFAAETNELVRDLNGLIEKVPKRKRKSR
jgi:hypothetical protein